MHEKVIKIEKKNKRKDQSEKTKVVKKEAHEWGGNVAAHPLGSKSKMNKTPAHFWGLVFRNELTWKTEYKNEKKNDKRRRKPNETETGINAE